MCLCRWQRDRRDALTWQGRGITLQAGSHTDGLGTRSGPLLAIAAGQAARNGLCRPLRSPRPPDAVEAEDVVPDDDLDDAA
jgi:hypothetical protein